MRTRTWPASSNTAGLVDATVVRRLACDATLVVALDDDVGHTMYEGRARRDPTPTQRRELWRRDRHCRFPGCANATFVNPHHIRWWRRDRGPTDLDNMALLCEHHHHLVHSKQWRLSGDANAELSFVGPNGTGDDLAPLAAVDQGARAAASDYRWLLSARRQGPDRPPDFSQRARCSIVIVRSDDLHMS